MNSKDVKDKSNSKVKTSKTKFPQIKIDGFHHAIANTDMLKVVEQITQNNNSESRSL